MPQELVVPGETVDVEEERPARVRDVRRVDATAGQPPGEERVHGPEGKLAALGARPETAARVEDVGDLGAGEVGVEGQAGPLPEERLEAGRAQSLAGGGGDPALPDDRVRDRGARGAVPDDRRLALVRDPERGDPRRPADCVR